MVEEQPKRCGVVSPERKESLSGDWYAPFNGPWHAMTSWTQARLFLKKFTRNRINSKNSNQVNIISDHSWRALWIVIFKSHFELVWLIHENNRDKIWRFAEQIYNSRPLWVSPDQSTFCQKCRFRTCFHSFITPPIYCRLHLQIFNFSAEYNRGIIAVLCSLEITTWTEELWS